MGQADVPAGIRVAAARIGGDPNSFRNRGQAATIFADGDGRPLYFSSSDAGCTGACLEQWHPALAPADAKAQGDWTLVAGAAGKLQWAFRGKPLYTFAAEPEFKEDFTQTRFRGFGGGRHLTGHGVDGKWAVARAEPTQWMKMPNGVSATEYAMAPGQILAVGVGVATVTGKPLYMFTGSSSQERKLPQSFRPRLAAMLDLPVGEFTIRERSDGTRQWAFRGAPLFTCECDVEVGDVNGAGAAAGIAPAVVLRYFTPAEVALRKNPLSGGRMVESKTGQTLYYRDRVKDGFDPDNLRAVGGYDPRVGASLGLKHCDADCEKEWKPLLAPANAKPQGYWSLYERTDGLKQWAYNNHAVYTHAGEPAGTLYGADTYQIRFDEGRGEAPVPVEFGMGILWRALVP